MPASTPRLDNIESQRNLIINGNFDFWQRGTSFAAVASGSLSADRFKYGKAGTVVHTISRSTDVPTLAQSGFLSQYSLLATVTTAQTSFTTNQSVSPLYKMEGFDYATIHGKTARIQFWVKNSIAGVYGLSLQNGVGDRSYVASYTVNAANTWEKKAIDVSLDTIGSWSIDSNTGLYIQFILAAGPSVQTSNLNVWQAGNFIAPTNQANGVATNGATFQIAQVQIVAGTFNSLSNLTFNRCGRNIQDELTMCQRYFEKSYPIDGPLGSTNQLGAQFAGSVANASATMPVSVLYKVTKRAPASTVLYNAVSGAANSVTYALQGALETAATPTLGVAGDSSFSFYISGATTDRIYYKWQFTADAEL